MPSPTAGQCDRQQQGKVVRIEQQRRTIQARYTALPFQARLPDREWRIPEQVHDQHGQPSSSSGAQRGRAAVTVSDAAVELPGEAGSYRNRSHPSIRPLSHRLEAQSSFAFNIPVDEIVATGDTHDLELPFLRFAPVSAREREAEARKVAAADGG